MATGISLWSTTALSNSSAPPTGAPEGMAPSAVNNVMREMMASVRTWYEDPAWINFGYAYTYVSTTSFKIVLQNYTAKYAVGRRVRAVGALTGTIYGTITASVFSTDTTVTVAWDSGTLNSETLEISVGLPSAGNPLSIGSTWAGTAGGTANAITLTPATALTAYVAGTVYEFIALSNNTSGTVTVAISGLATRNLKKSIGGGIVALAVNDVRANVIYRVIDDGTQLILQSPQTYSHGADVATASTVDLTSVTGDYLFWTGTTTVNTVTLSEGREVTCKATGAFQITNGASLVCTGAANITTVSGDTFILRGEASGVVKMINYTRADGSLLGGITTAALPTGTIVARGIATYSTNVGLTVAIPFDNTIPQSTEGTQIISTSWTALSSTNRVRLTFTAFGSVSAGVLGIAASAFINGSANAAVTGCGSTGGTSSPGTIHFIYEYVPGNTSSQSITIRVGGNSGTVSLNGVNAGNYFGSSAMATLIIEEIKA